MPGQYSPADVLEADTGTHNPADIQGSGAYHASDVESTVSPPASGSTPIAGPTFNAQPQRPWYHQVLDAISNLISPGSAPLPDRLVDAVAGPGSLLSGALINHPDIQAALDKVGIRAGGESLNYAAGRPGTADRPLANLENLRAEDAIPGNGTPSQIARGAVEGAESFGSGLTTPTNAAILAGTAGLGEALPVVSRLLSTGFSLQMLRSAFDQSPQFTKQVQNGDYEGATKTLTQIGLSAAAGVLSAKHAASPEGIAPVRPDEISPETARGMAPSPDATSARPTDEGLMRLLRTEPPGTKRDAYEADARNRGIDVPPAPRPRAEQAADAFRETLDYDKLFEDADHRLQQRETAANRSNNQQQRRGSSSVPEEGVPDQVTRVQYARENLARQMEGMSFSDLQNSSRLAIDDLVRQGYGMTLPKESPEAQPEKPGEEGGPESTSEAANSNTAQGEVGDEPRNEPPEKPGDVKPARQPQNPVAYGSNTDVRIPGENRSYPAVYSVREASDVYPSHNPFSFEPTPDYYHRNDRNYAEPRNAERVVKQEAEFDPGFMVNDNPDATNGPPIIDEDGNVLGGNSRTMTLARVRENRPEASAAYKNLVRQQAKRFGIAPQLVDRMENPVLTREMTGEYDPQQAITDLNKTGTAALTQAERAISDSKRLSPDTADYLARRIDEQGSEGTLAQALEGAGGRDIVNRLVDDGVITTQEKPQLLNGDGSMTPEGKQRVGRLLSGQFFNSARELEETPPELRAKLDRIVPSVMRTAQRGDWDLTEPVKEAVSLLKDAKARGVPVDDLVRQEGLFGTGGHSDEAVAIARTLEGKPTEITRAFRQYASDEALSRPGTPMTMGFEPPAREDAFKAAFGEKSEGKSAEFPGKSRSAGAAATPLGPPGRTKRTSATPAGANTAAPGTTAVSAPQIATRWARLKDTLLKWLAPAARTDGARETSYVMREMGAKLANRFDQAHETLKAAHKYFAAQPLPKTRAFIDAVEAGDISKLPLGEQVIARTLRQMLDTSRDAVRALGTGKLESWLENYFPHMWENPAAARSWIGDLIAKGPLQGRRAFLKQRSIETFADGIAAGLKPISDNPVDLVLAKLHEMNKYVLAHEALNEMKERGLVEYHDANWKPTPGYKRIEDAIATVFGKPTVTVEESFDKPLMDQLDRFARSLGINHERNVRLQGVPRGALGFATPAGDVQTKFGSPEQVLAHEIGHIVEFKYGISKALKGPGIAKELNDLAALRWEGAPNAPAKYKSYARTVDEKMANAIAAMIYAPERFREVAPKTWDLLRDELYAHPALRPLLNVKKSMTLGRSTDEVPVGGMVVRGHYWAPEDRATIVNNYLSPGMRGDMLYDAYMGLGNGMNQLQLGFSLFHAGTTAMEAMISKDALAIRQAGEGRGFAALKSHLGAIAAPFTTAMQGNELLKEMMRPGTQGAEIAQLADAAIVAGGRARQDRFYDTGQAQKMADAFRRGGFGGVAEGLARSPLALPDLASHGLMKELVPRLKLGAFADLARFEMSRLGPDATPKDAQAAMSRAWDSIDNRFGQVVYDNLFWNKMWKDMAMASVRAVGWDLGSLREGAGGIKDAIAGNSEGERLTNRSAYLAAMTIRTGIMGGLMYYALTGNRPQKAMDYFFPGGHSMPGFAKDAVNWATHPVDTAKGKIHPLASLIWDVMNNKDYFDHPISRAEWTHAQHWIDDAKYVGSEVLPITIRSVMKGQMPTNDDMFQFFGMPKAPRALRDPK
ncbi:MAG TPA: hypothetical protein VHZ74_10825 [Bryobacteraceae bacterium]|jgi:hypothetical protein|nr:hypothetical protein [Bryobacteraceae bacterium]